MDFDREYQKRRQPGDLDDFTDSNVQALVEGRRKKALPRPNIAVETDRLRVALDNHDQRSIVVRKPEWRR